MHENLQQAGIVSKLVQQQIVVCFRFQAQSCITPHMMELFVIVILLTVTGQWMKIAFALHHYNLPKDSSSAGRISVLIFDTKIVVLQFTNAVSQSVRLYEFVFLFLYVTLILFINIRLE